MLKDYYELAKCDSIGVSKERVLWNIEETVFEIASAVKGLRNTPFADMTKGGK